MHQTLIRLEPSRGIVYREIMGKYGVNARAKEIKQAFSETWNNYGDGKISNEHAKHRREKDIERWWLGFHYEMLDRLGHHDAQKAVLINREITNQFYGNPKVHRTYKDTKKILAILKKQNVPLVLATNGYKSTIEVIKYFGLGKYFDFIQISCEVGISKPNPEFFLRIAKRLKLKPKEILCVGDSYPTDIKCAKNACCGAAIINRKKGGFKKKYNCIRLNNLLQIRDLIQPARTSSRRS